MRAVGAIGCACGTWPKELFGVGVVGGMHVLLYSEKARRRSQ